jgi:hypothetical protein
VTPTSAVSTTEETWAMPIGRQATSPIGESITTSPRVWTNW